MSPEKHPGPSLDDEKKGHGDVPRYGGGSLCADYQREVEALQAAFLPVLIGLGHALLYLLDGYLQLGTTVQEIVT